MLLATCTRLCAPSAARTLRSHSSRAATGPSTAAIAFLSDRRSATDTRLGLPDPSREASIGCVGAAGSDAAVVVYVLRRRSASDYAACWKPVPKNNRQ